MNCPKCGTLIKPKQFPFGADVKCPKCRAKHRTDYDFVSDGEMYWWIIGKHDKKEGPVLKISQPYIRETPVRDEKEGRNVVMKIEPPGLTIGFRLRGGRTTWHLPIADAYMAARYSMKQDPKRTSYERVKPASVRDAILAVLKDKGKMNIAQVMQQLKDKGTAIERKHAGEYLEMLKELGQVKQEGFSYELVTGEGKKGGK